MPLIIAVVVLKDKPAGKVPLLTDHVKGPRPPVTASACVYGVPTFPPGSVVGLMDGAGGKLTRMLRGPVPDWGGLLWSVTITVKLVRPLGPVGVPVMAPAGLMLRPRGRLPVLTVNANAPRPPVAATVWLYAVPSTPAASVVVVIDGGAGKLMAILRACVAVIGVMVLESVTLTVKFAVTLGPVGVPEIVPVPLRVRPAGNAPALIENVTVPAPPVFATAWL